LPANGTVNVLDLWGLEIELAHNFDETWASLCHLVQTMKAGRKTAQINTKNLASFITVKACCSMTHLKQQKSFGFF